MGLGLSRSPEWEFLSYDTNFSFVVHPWDLQGLRTNSFLRRCLASLASCRLPGHLHCLTRSAECSEPLMAGSRPLEKSRSLGWELCHSDLWPVVSSPVLKSLNSVV
jgi:hypothetical protein